jgi:hypothetical protein
MIHILSWLMTDDVFRTENLVNSTTAFAYANESE